MNVCLKMEDRGEFERADLAKELELKAVTTESGDEEKSGGERETIKGVGSNKLMDWGFKKS